MTDSTAIIAERDDYKRRAEANHAACEAMKRRLEECAEKLAMLESAYAKDVTRLKAERDAWKVEAMRMVVDKGEQHE